MYIPCLANLDQVGNLLHNIVLFWFKDTIYCGVRIQGQTSKSISFEVNADIDYTSDEDFRRINWYFQTVFGLCSSQFVTFQSA